MSILDDHCKLLRHVLEGLPDLDAAVREAAAAIAQSFRNDGKLLAAGNGGSAAEAQHLTGELIGRLHPARDRRALSAIALHADTSTLTAVANDFGFERIFARQVEAIGRPGDVLVVLSTSGASKNLVSATEVAADIGMVTIGLLGSGSRPLHERCTHVLAVPSDSLQAIQECHLVLVHVLVEQVEDLMAGKDEFEEAAPRSRS